MKLQSFWCYIIILSSLEKATVSADVESGKSGLRSGMREALLGAQQDRSLSLIFMSQEHELIKREDSFKRHFVRTKKKEEIKIVYSIKLE